jgi:PAS domain S-box-containing protein
MMPFVPASGVAVQLPEPAAADPLQARLGAAVGDPSLRLLHWLDDEQCWVDAAGTRQDPPVPQAGRAATPVARDGATVALVEHAGELDAEALQRACADMSAAFGSEREIAALRTRMRALERTEQRLLEVFETLELIVAAMDLDATLTYANAYTTRISGWSRSEMLGQNWFQMFRTGRESFLERVRQGDFPARDQSTIVTRFGERREIDWYNVPLRDDGGRITGILGMGRGRSRRPSGGCGTCSTPSS